MVNPGEASVNVVTENKPKVLIGLGQKGTWSGPGAPNSSGADGAPPAKRRDLNHPRVPPAERGKPVVLLCPRQQGEPQGDLTGQRVQEGGASESRPVMGRTGVEPPSDITPPAREQTSPWCGRTGKDS